MKSAYAMERLQKQAPQQTLSDEQRRELAEIDNRYEAKMAEKKVFLGSQIEQARGNPAELEQLQTQLRRELERLQDEREEKKERVRSRK